MTTATPVVEENAGAPVTDADLERLWLATQRCAWRSLALIPIGDAVPTARLAEALATVGGRHLGETVAAIDATSVSLPSLHVEVDAIAKHARSGERVVVALPPLHDRPSGVALARTVDAAVVCVALGSSSIAEAERVLEEIGRDRVLGSVILEERKEKR